MASNTFALPASSTSLSVSRINWNNSMRAVAENFYGSAIPTSVNYSIEGVATSIPDGVLFRSSTTGALYISDSAKKKDAPLGGNWTRNGIAVRIEESLVAAVANIATYEIGELFVTVNSNARLYMKSTNVGAIVDVGQPGSDTITAAMLQTDSVTNVKLASGSVNTRAIENASITNVKFAASSVNTNAIENSSITNVKFAAGSVNNRAIDNQAIAWHHVNPTGNVARTNSVGAWGAQQYIQRFALGHSSNVYAMNCDNGNVQNVILANTTCTFSAPTNMKDGGSYVLYLKQDGTGSRVVTWNSVFKWPNGTAPTLSTGANSLDIISFNSDGTNMYGTFTKGFS